MMASLSAAADGGPSGHVEGSSYIIPCKGVATPAMSGPIAATQLVGVLGFCQAAATGHFEHREFAVRPAPALQPIMKARHVVMSLCHEDLTEVAVL